MMMTALLYLLQLILFAPNQSECSSTGANIDKKLMIINLMLKH
jgi:hypothetical protein